MTEGDRPGKLTGDSERGRSVVLGTVLKVGTTTGKVALLPFRAAARTPLVRERTERLAEAGREVTIDVRHKLEDAAVGALETPDAERTIDRALAGPLPETIARSAVQHHVLQRVIAEMLATADRTATITPAGEEPGTEELVQQALASPAVERLMADLAGSMLAVELADQLTRSPAFHRALRNVLSSPEMRAALTDQTTGFAGEMRNAVRRRAMVVDEGYGRYGVTGEIASVIAEGAFYNLEAPVKRMGAMHVPIPFSPPLEDVTVPTEQTVFQAARALCGKA